MNELAHYDAACAALAAAVTTDEVMAIRTTAKGIEAVAKAAKNLDLEIDAVKLRVRAEAKLGDMLREAQSQGLLRSGRPTSEEGNGSAAEPLTRVKLREIGIDKKLSAYSQKLSGIGTQAVDAMLERFDESTRGRGKLALDVITSETAKRNAESRRQLARELSDCSALQPSGRKFPVVYADPAWKRKAGIGDRAYENSYTTMDWDAIMAMPVKERLLPDAWIFLWIPRAHVLALHSVPYVLPLGNIADIKLPLAWAIARAWGADNYSTCFVWTKTDEDMPDDHGLGLIAWDQDELLCLFKRGRGLPKPDTAAKFGSNHRERAAGPAAKPTYYRDMINAMTGNLPVLELFAREDEGTALPANFFTWGNQSNNSAEVPIDESGAAATAPPEPACPVPAPPGGLPSHAGSMFFSPLA